MAPNDRMSFVTGPVLTANSAITLDSSSAETRDAVASFLHRLAQGGDPQAQADRSSGHFISRVGQARVVWKREGDEITVISIFIP